MDTACIRRQLASKKVGIAGCGGLGSNCAVALIRCGLGSLVIADFDTVDRSNLNRQYYFQEQIGMKKVDALKSTIAAIEPDCRVEVHDVKLRPDDIVRIFGHCDVIVEAFDHAREKEMIITTVMEKLADKMLITGIGLAGYGRNNELRAERQGNLFICGDQGSEVSADNPALAPRVGIVANMQANQVLEILLNTESDENNPE
ncbi:MAG: sulfur carrier protein ThiS adenylyltransferase ThiF [Bacteroidales bacterium]